MKELWYKASKIPTDLRSSVWSAVDRMVKRYENISGLSEVRLAQEKVLEAERIFTEKQRLRRQSQSELQKTQERHRELQLALERTPRTDDRFLSLLTEEHSVLKNERAITTNLHEVEMCEREAFNVLSARLRESHEKERERVERTKYWSIIGSVVGALLGIIGTTVNNEWRMHEIKRIVGENSASLKLQPLASEVSQLVESHRKQIAFLDTRLKDLLSSADNRSSAPSSRWLSRREDKSLNADADGLLSAWDSKSKFTFALSVAAAAAGVLLVLRLVNGTK